MSSQSFLTGKTMCRGGCIILFLYGVTQVKSQKDYGYF